MYKVALLSICTMYIVICTTCNCPAGTFVRTLQYLHVSTSHLCCHGASPATAFRHQTKDACSCAQHIAVCLCKCTCVLYQASYPICTWSTAASSKGGHQCFASPVGRQGNTHKERAVMCGRRLHCREGPLHRPGIGEWKTIRKPQKEGRNENE